MKKRLLIIISIIVSIIAINLSLVGCDVNGPRENAPDAGRDANRAVMTDTDLKNVVKKELDTDADLRAANLNIDADADHNEVTLSGRVGSQDLRSRAVEMARSAHSGLVINDKIDVIPEEISREAYTEEQAREERERASKRGDTIGSSIDDAWIHTKITTKFMSHPKTLLRNVNVDVKNGVVTLRGNVDTAAEREEAEQVAKGTDGVKRVVSRIKVGSSTPSNRT
jgi:hyperosmotically inducible periplasmic protein